MKSETSSFVLAAIPPAPASAPTEDATVTSASQVKVDIEELDSLAQTGGSSILEYCIQMDDGAGHFSDISTEAMALSANAEAVTGVTYSFRYRARNIYGWSNFSPIVQILAASPPSIPPKPTFVASSDNSISLQLFPSQNDMGSIVTAYVLEMD